VDAVEKTGDDVEAAILQFGRRVSVAAILSKFSLTAAVLGIPICPFELMFKRLKHVTKNKNFFISNFFIFLIVILFDCIS